MPRVATCKDCGARFKVPESTTATRAKCKSCGGVLEIPPAEKAPGKTPAASKRTAPVKTAPSRTTSVRSAASRRGGSSRRVTGRSSQDSESKTGLIVGIAIVVIAAAVGGWWMFSGDDTPTPAPDEAGTTSGADESKSPSSAEQAPASPTAGEDTTTDKSGAAASANDPAPAKAELPPRAKAPAPAAAAAAQDPDAPLEPLPTLIEFEPLQPALGSTEEELAEWTALIKALYVDNFGGATGRKRKALLGKVRDLDPVLSVPAFLNAASGVDIGDEIYMIAMYNMVDDWQQSVGHKPTFSYPADTTRMDTKVQNLRVLVLQGWRNWWVDVRLAGQDQAKLDEYRLMVEKALRGREEG